MFIGCCYLQHVVLPKYGGLAKLCLEETESIVTEVCVNELGASLQLLCPLDFLTEFQVLHQTSATNLIKTEYHWLGKDQFCSGAAFVPRVGGSNEDDGWIVSFVHDERTNTSQASFHYTILHTTPIFRMIDAGSRFGSFMFLCCRCSLLTPTDLKVLLLLQ